MPLIYCLLFGALISPTDPIAVLASILKQAAAPKSLETKITGESSVQRWPGGGVISDAGEDSHEWGEYGP
jgi:hypothetical protein